MTAVKELHAKPFTTKVKIKSVETHVSPTGEYDYTVYLFRPYLRGFSQFEDKTFIRAATAEQAQEIADYLEGQQDQVVTVRLVPGNLRLDKQRNRKPDDGDFKNYWWNIAEVVQAAAQELKKEKDAKADADSLFGPEPGATTAKEGALVPAEPKEEEPGPVEPKAADPWHTRDQHMAAAWAIGAALEYLRLTAVDGVISAPGQRLEDALLVEVHRLAERFLAMKNHMVEKGFEQAEAA